MKIHNGQTLRVGFTCSTFDLLHAGHILMLEEAKQQCDYLICGLQTDPTIDRPETKNKPVQSIVERHVQLSAVKHVDQVVIYSTEQDLIDLLQILPIDIRILGEEYENKPFTGRKECEALGMGFYFNSRTHRFSSTELRARVIHVESQREQAANVPLPIVKDAHVEPTSAHDYRWIEP